MVAIIHGGEVQRVGVDGDCVGHPLIPLSEVGDFGKVSGVPHHEICALRDRHRLVLGQRTPQIQHARENRHRAGKRVA